jgi:hypothetical protein
MCLYANGRASPAENRRFEVRILVDTLDTITKIVYYSPSGLGEFGCPRLAHNQKILGSNPRSATPHWCNSDMSLFQSEVAGAEPA